jgi:hypothetical protein
MRFAPEALFLPIQNRVYGAWAEVVSFGEISRGQSLLNQPLSGKS